MIPAKKLIALYTEMLRFRRVAESAERTVQDGKARFETLRGRESLLAGIAVDLVPGDTVILCSEPLLPALLQGSSISALLMSYPQNGNGKIHEARLGPPRKRAVQDQPNRADDFLRAAHEAAKLQRIRSKRRIVMALCAAEDSGAGDWRHSLSKSNREKLPIVFVQWTNEAGGKQSRIAKNGHALNALRWGVPIITVDAGDVLAVYRVASEAIARARHRRGPTVIDCIANMPAAFAPMQPVDGLVPVRDSILDLELYLEERRLNPAQVKSRFHRAFSRETGGTDETFHPVRV